MTVGRYLDFPFDKEVFNYSWKNTPDLFLDNILASGAVERDSEIARLIANGSNSYVVPYYNNLGGDEQLYDGVTDFTYDSITGGHYKGVVYGRMKAWDAISFIKDFNSGADPMGQIVKGVATYWQKKRQERLVKLLETIFNITDTDFANHTLDIASETGTVGEENIIGATTIGDAIVKANGDNASGYSLAIMHSKVAQDLANLQLLEFSKYTDERGITRRLPIANINGMTVIVNDGVPVDKKISYALTDDETLDDDKTYYTKHATKDEYTAVAEPDEDNIATYYEKTDLPDEYTTFILGNGAIKFEDAPVAIPVEMARNAEKAGGKDMIYTRVRETFAPYGFSFTADVSAAANIAVPDSILLDPENWERHIDAKAVMMARVISN